eukprot:scaffold68733_cov63-Phaeocystis_antarctica.AAC.4
MASAAECVRAQMTRAGIFVAVAARRGPKGCSSGIKWCGVQGVGTSASAINRLASRHVQTDKQCEPRARTATNARRQILSATLLTFYPPCCSQPLARPALVQRSSAPLLRLLRPTITQ